MFSKTFFVFAALAAGFGAVEARRGEATFYDPRNGYGACGTRIPDSQLAVALSPDQWASGKNCGREIVVNYHGKQVRAKVRDLCPGCGTNGLDLTRTAFARIADPDLGRIQVDWNYVS